MNKDVIYIEPEDDITDIISKLESAKEKIIALIPPKKAGVLKSIVNIKLIFKTAAAAGKTVVLVTTDQSIIKLAAIVRIPITKDLQTAPHIPTEKDIDDEGESIETIAEEVIEDEDEVVIKDNTVNSEPKDKPRVTKNSEPKQAAEDESTDIQEDEASKDEKSSIEDSESTDMPETESQEETKSQKNDVSKKDKKPAKTKLGAWMQNHKKLITVCSSILGVLLIALIWAFFIAPSVKIDIKIRTTANNFSEVVSFIENQAEEKAEEGKFYLETLKVESPIKIEFAATGSKNIGDKATGKLVIYTYFSGIGRASVPSSATFTYNNNNYHLKEDTVLAWDDGAFDSCENTMKTINDKCLISATVEAEAVEGGSRYNAPASESGWTTSIPNILVYSVTDFSGGTDKTITVVQQSDVENAKKQISIVSEEESQAKLNEQISDDRIVVRNTFKQETAAITTHPNIGEEITEGEKPYISTNTVATMYAIDKTSVETFIKAKAKLNENYKIYSMSNPYVENFLATDNDYTGKLKTSYTSGPKVTESELLEKIKGHRLGDVQVELRSIDGISDIKIEKSVPWVFSIPNDSNKITINLVVEE